jgi:hypothetical protein
VRSAAKWLERHLLPSHVGIEWGSGRSTIWLARRVKFLWSIETNSDWHSRVSTQLRTHELATRVDYRLIEIPYQEGYESEDIDSSTSRWWTVAIGGSVH